MRRVLSVLLALVMLLTPVLGMAASPAEMLDQAWSAGCTVNTQVSFELAELPIPEEVKTVIEDMVKALGFRALANPEGKTEVALTLQRQDALAIGVEPAGDDLYLKLPLVTPQVMAFNGEEFLVTLERVVLMIAEASGASESDMAQIKALFDGGLESVAESMMESVETMDFQMPEIDVDTLLAQVMGSMEPLQQVEQPADCDPVSNGVRINITPELIESIVKIACDILAANPGMLEALQQADLEIDPEALKKAPAAAAAEFKAEYGVVPVTILMDDNGDVPYVDIVFTPVDGGVVSKASYVRHAVEEGMHYALNFMDDGDGVCLLGVDTCTADKTEYGFAIFPLEDGQKQGVLFEGGFSQTLDRKEQTAHDVTKLYAMISTGSNDPAFVNVSLNVDQQAEVLGNGVKCDTVVSLGCDLLGGDIVTVKVNTVADDTVIPSIANDAAVRPGKMTDEEFADFVNAVPNNALTAVFSMLQLLPESVLMLMMN